MLGCDVNIKQFSFSSMHKVNTMPLLDDLVRYILSFSFWGQELYSSGLKRAKK